MLKIGCHLSSAKGFLAMGKDAVSIGANTFQFFTRNPRGSKAKEIDPADAAALRELAQREGISNILAHAPYTLNACSADPKVREFRRLHSCSTEFCVRSRQQPCCWKPWPGREPRSEGVFLSCAGYWIRFLSQRKWAFASIPAMCTMRGTIWSMTDRKSVV